MWADVGLVLFGAVLSWVGIWIKARLDRRDFRRTREVDALEAVTELIDLLPSLRPRVMILRSEGDGKEEAFVRDAERAWELTARLRRLLSTAPAKTRVAEDETRRAVRALRQRMWEVVADIGRQEDVLERHERAESANAHAVKKAAALADLLRAEIR